jgi:serine/threonine-protein kinase CLA4
VASGTDSSSANLALGAQRAADYVNGSYPHTIAVSQPSGVQRPAPNLSASRPAPPRPLLTGTRPAPSVPSTSKPDTADLKQRAKPQGSSDAAVQERKDSLQPSLPEDRDRERERERDRERERERERQRTQREQAQDKEQPDSKREQQGEDQWPVPAASKSAPANTNPPQSVTSSVATVTNGPPPVKPLQTAKKPTQPGGITAVVDGDDSKAPGSGGVAAAAAALEKPKPKDVEKRISTMTEAQIMEKMRSVVDPDDPKLLYSKIKKIGQGYVICCRRFCGDSHKCFCLS